jgi:hypothetical protein
MPYQVLRSGVVVTVAGAFGPEKQGFDERAILPPGVPEREIRHLLSVKLIRQVGGPPQSTPDMEEPAEESVGTAAQATDPEVEAARAQARAKLPADGSAPDGRAAQTVWVEHAVAKGYAYDAVKGLGKDELRDLLADKQ